MKRFAQISITIIILISLFIPSGLEFAGKPIRGVEAQTADTTFAIITDFGYANNTTVANVAKMVNDWDPEFIVTAGDNSQGTTCNTGCYEGVVGAYYGPQAVSAGRTDFMTPDNFYPVPGNHDYYAGGTGELGNYLAYFTSLITLPPSGAYTGATNRYYDFVRGPVHFFMMDSGSVDNAAPPNWATQTAWLQAALTASEAPWQIVMMHRPPYTSGTYHSSDVNLQLDYAKWGADFVIAGHNHIYERIYKNEGNLRYITAGTAGSDTRTGSSTFAGLEDYYFGSLSGAMKVVASDTSITLQYITTDGTPQDTYTQTQEAPTDPSISVTPASLEFTDPSEVKSYTVSGVRLTHDVVVTPSASIEISLSSDSGFSNNSITLTPTSGELAATPIYTRIVSGAKSNIGTITNTSEGALQKDVTISADFTRDLCFDLTFQEGLDSYAGTVDTYISQNSPTTSYATAEEFGWDNNDPYYSQSDNFGLLRFDNIFGDGVNLIPSGSTIETATLTYVVSDTGDAADVNEVAIDWAETVTYNTFGPTAGVQTGDYGLGVGSATAATRGAKTLDVQASLQSWSNGTINYGWIFRPTGSGGVDVRSSEYGTQADRPKLDVRYCIASTEPTIVVTPNALSFYALPSTVSDIKTYTVSGYNLEADITITPPTLDFEISTDGVTFTNSPITLTQTGGIVSETPIYVRMKSLAVGTYSGSISHTSGTLLETVNLTGVVSESYLGMVINGDIATTGSQQVILDMSFGGATPTTMRFQNVPDGTACPTGDTGWSTAEDYSATASWTLSGTTSGTYKVCAQASLDGTTYTLAAEDTIDLQTDYTYPNPDLTASCGLDIVLVIDLSSSISPTELDQYKAALTSFVTALQNTPTNVSLVTFNLTAQILDLDPNTAGVQDWVRLSPTTATTINDIINALTTGTGTNWDDALRKARLQFEDGTDPSDAPDMIVFATDGDPSTWGGHDGDTPPTPSGSYATMLTYAIPEAEEAKAAGIHMLGLGIGISGGSVTRLQAISGSEAFVPSSGNITTADYYVATTFGTELTDALSDLVISLCGGSVTVNKVITTSLTDRLNPANWIVTANDPVLAGWQFKATVTSTDDSLDETSPSKTTTNAGNVNFKVNLGGDLEATLDIVEDTVKDYYTFVGAVCSIDGVSTPVVYEISTRTVTGIPVQNNELTNCTFVNFNPRDPTGVVLGSFVANSLPGGVMLTWETFSETNTLGFKLYRSATQDGERVPLNNGDMILTLNPPSSTSGAVYSFFDPDVLPGETYYYWLQEYSLDPFMVNEEKAVSVTCWWNWLFLPLITK